ncbi:gamma-glutamyltranspeptidase [Punctularia strigosozonata HHB-11173 SS5]|uniref:gamma-glutamyltranspeptidase n=1 Tax=Punctularia strigosozonata (strain HHB-11173) TaxID=741275 RepID=UPI0004417029|nr:gamma-glutamyltranspeptidase [Punctularia strigosozonata HHB-11173 SS5]EIN11894.1 gamma-glutamyltranspeptidase [Punctularia strigosozonata HHB-11173 SS5]
MYLTSENSGYAKLRNPSYLIEAKHGAVATENQVCSEMGVDIMKAGGNAVDAAVASTLCIGVANMFSSGVGGGGFMTIRIPPALADGISSEVWTIDFRETAPAASNESMYVSDPNLARFGGLSVGVPGELRGLQEAHNRWGKLSWSQVVMPAAELALGWPVSKELALRIKWPFFYDLMFNNPDFQAIFAPEGRLLEEGEIIKRTNLSWTLTTVAEKGADAFYKGAIADSIVEKVKATGGILTREDMANYSVIVRKALEGTYRGRKIYTTHAPTSGPVLLHMFNLLEHYDFDLMLGVNVHRVVEAMKFGFAARTKICDPAFNDDANRIHEIATKEFADKIVANLTDDRTHAPDYYNPVFDVKIDHGTSHISTVDQDGMAVAITSTVNLIFGSQVMDGPTGIILNDEMDDFSVPGIPNAFGLLPSPYNYPEPFKRPLSSTTPTILENEDGSFHLAIGGSGGSRIFPAVFQTIVNVDDWGMNLQQAVEFGRLHDQLYPLIVDADDVYPPDLLDELRHRGHNVTVLPVERVAAVVNAVMQDGRSYYAASDSRKNGIAAGY